MDGGVPQAAGGDGHRVGQVGAQARFEGCERCRMRGILWPVVWFTMGVLFLMDNLHGPDIERTWPLFLLVVGAVKLLQSNASEAGHLGGPPVMPPADTARSAA